jgi:putative hydrolases of HD superfamily
MDRKSSEEILAKLVELSALSFQYGETYRATTYPDGKTLESDTDHTVMLGLIACSLAELCAPELDRGKLAEYALIHDLVEVYAGDTPTLGMTDKSEKEAREYAALQRIQKEYDQTFPWLSATITSYESQKTPEARFIKVLDKLMPPLTQLQNEGEVFTRLAVPTEQIEVSKNVQREWVRQTAEEWPLLIELYELALQKVFSLPYFQK